MRKGLLLGTECFEGGAMMRGAMLGLGHVGGGGAMIRGVLLVLGFFAGGSAIAVRAQSGLQPADKVCTVQFTIKNLGFKVSGSFGGVSGKIVFDAAAPGNASFDVTVEAASVNTDNSMRDDHLRKEGFFDVEHYAKIRIVSDGVVARRGGYLFNGKLTIKGVTKPISFPFTVVKVDGGYRFRGTFTVNRRDFGIGGFSTISDNAELSLDVTAK